LRSHHVVIVVVVVVVVETQRHWHLKAAGKRAVLDLESSTAEVPGRWRQY
jgi:hypothetical protein